MLFGVVYDVIWYGVMSWSCVVWFGVVYDAIWYGVTSWSCVVWCGMCMM